MITGQLDPCQHDPHQDDDDRLVRCRKCGSASLPPLPPRTTHHYIVGLPVAVQVRADGSVYLEVDLTELDGAVLDASDEQSGDIIYTAEEVDADVQTIRAYRAGATPIEIEGRS